MMRPTEIGEAFARLRAFSEKKPWAYRDTDHYPLRDLANIERHLWDLDAQLWALTDHLNAQPLPFDVAVDRLTEKHKKETD